MENNRNFQKYLYFWLALLLGMSFFLYGHLVDIFPANSSEWLANRLQANAGQIDLGSIATFCLFLIIQLGLAGILLDKFGVRLLTILSLVVCMLGTYFFAYNNNDSFISVLLSRILMGMGIAFVTVSYIKVVAEIMPSNQFSLMGGMFTTSALLGSIFGRTSSMGHFAHYTWQQVVIVTAAAALMLAVLRSTTLRDNQQLPLLPGWREIYRAFKNPQNWLLTAYSGLAVAPIMVLTMMAGKPFFEEAYHYTHQQVLILGGFLLAGLSVGAPLAGYLAGLLKRRRALMLVGILVQQISFLPLIYLHRLPLWLNAILLVWFGLASSTFVLSFAIGKEINRLSVMGTIVSLIQIGIVMVTVITDQIIGKILISQWDGGMIGNIPYFSVFNYHVAFTIFPIYLLLGFILLLFVDEPTF